MKSPGPASAVYSSLSPQRMRALPLRTYITLYLPSAKETLRCGSLVRKHLKVAMVMSAGFRIGMDVNCPSPELLSADSSEVDGGCAIHARCLCCVVV